MSEDQAASVQVHPPYCIRPDGGVVERDPHILDGTCDCICPACTSKDGLLCICPECKGAECPDNIWQANRDRT